jgi:hypothetical protein
MRSCSVAQALPGQVQEHRLQVRFQDLQRRDPHVEPVGQVEQLQQMYQGGFGGVPASQAF